jgi:hypothetical protein
MNPDLERFITALEQSLWERYQLAEKSGDRQQAAILLSLLNAIAVARKVN